jgi:hypothetical protein
MCLGGAGCEAEPIVTDRHTRPLLCMGRYEHVSSGECPPALPPGGNGPDNFDVPVRCPDGVAVHFPASVMDDDLLPSARHGTGSGIPAPIELPHF